MGDYIFNLGEELKIGRYAKECGNGDVVRTLKRVGGLWVLTFHDYVAA